MPHLHFEQTVPLSLEETFHFFEDPYNLLKITPPAMALTVTNPDKVQMRKGAEITYKLRVAGVPQRWRTLIKEYDPPHSFVDIQLKGPYKKWEHTHILRRIDGGTLMVDEIEYELPMGALGQLVAGWFVRKQLTWVFQHRKVQIKQLLGSIPSK